MYPYANDVMLQFEKIKFFIAELELADNSGAKTSISEVNLVELSGKTAATAADGTSITIENVKGGEYQSIQFYVGLSERLNNLTPADLAAESALNDGTYWPDWGSFIFSTITGKADLDLDGTPEHSMVCLLYTSPSPRDATLSRMPSSA